MRISVIGGGSVTDEQETLATNLGREIGQRDHTVVCGGLGGTMAAVCRGAKRASGRTIGILPTEDRAAANQHVDCEIATGLGHARNALVALNGDGLVALPGGPGTLTELGYARIYDRPAVGIDTHELPWLEQVTSPTAAVDQLEAAVTP